MENSPLLTILLPVALGIIMLGLGLSLTFNDFRRVILYPKAVFIGLFCQMILLPLVAFALVLGFNVQPELAVGLMLLAASPGGPTANLYSHLSKGDVALNISLTAVNSLLTLVSLPLIVNFSIGYFLESGQAVPMQFKKIMEVFTIVLVPVIIGMIIRRSNPAFATRFDKPIRILSAAFLVLIIAAAVVKEKENIGTYFEQAGTMALLFNLLSMAIGYYLPLLFRLEKKQAIAIGMEIGLHNGTLALYIALSVLQNSAMSIPPAIYSLIMFFTAAGFGWLVNRERVKVTTTV